MDTTLIDILPADWKQTAAIAIVAIPLLGRAYHALRTNGGLKGVWNALIFGTNTPQK